VSLGIVNNWNIVFLSNIFYYLKGIFPHGISLSLILYMEPTTIPFIFSKQPLRFKFIIMRSIWYSSKSSINKILSVQSIAEVEPYCIEISKFHLLTHDAVPNLFITSGAISCGAK
jgi:hypothetical protein